MDSPLKLRQRGALVFVVATLACASQPVKPGGVGQSGSPSGDSLTLKQWALSRCIAKAADGTEYAGDALRTAAALLERGSADISVYEKLDVLVDKFVARDSRGSVAGSYHTLDCIELYNSSELSNAVHKE